ncbi:MAG: protease SohB [Gammaproteobacteria bacterium]|nr:protease SohB [Gammaproteobacteria bacterium]
MLDALFQLSLFSAKAIILVVLILVLFAGIIGLFSRGKHQTKLSIKNLNSKYKDIKKEFLAEILSKKSFKKYIKENKHEEKTKKSDNEDKKNIFILNFDGDIKASAVNSLREEITAILNVATSKDEVIVRLESPGGMVHAYGLAAAQLSRIREKGIPLIVSVDKVAASGGYLMACIANKILAAPFAIIGSIGVIVQLPNFHRLLKEKKVDFEQITAGSFKRTLTLFGENTESGREKMHEEIEEIHTLFKNVIVEHRPQIDIDKVATGEHWLAKQAIELQLIDELRTSDDYLLEQSQKANLFEIHYKAKKTFSEKLLTNVQALKTHIFGQSNHVLL